ncbi:MAG: hypothetical protein AAFP98_11095, partial [Pseudomonadota bacterium]
CQYGERERKDLQIHGVSFPVGLTCDVARRSMYGRAQRFTVTAICVTWALTGCGVYWGEERS